MLLEQEPTIVDETSLLMLGTTLLFSVEQWLLTTVDVLRAYLSMFLSRSKHAVVNMLKAPTQGRSQGPDFGRGGKGKGGYLRDVGRHLHRGNLKIYIGFLKF